MTDTAVPAKKRQRKKRLGSQLKRTIVIQTRLSPKLRFVAELIARHQNRTLSTLIESLLTETAGRYRLPLVLSEAAQTDHYLFGERRTQKLTAQEAGERLWSAEEADRFAAMALFTPSLLTGEEQNLWQVITDISYFWNHFEIRIENQAGKLLETEWWPLIDYRGFHCERLREHWPLCQAILEGKESIDTLKALTLPSGKLVEKPEYYPHPIKKVRREDHDD